MISVLMKGIPLARALPDFRSLSAEAFLERYERKMPDSETRKADRLQIAG